MHLLPMHLFDWTGGALKQLPEAEREELLSLLPPLPQKSSGNAENNDTADEPDVPVQSGKLVIWHAFEEVVDALMDSLPRPNTARCKRKENPEQPTSTTLPGSDTIALSVSAGRSHPD